VRYKKFIFALFFAVFREIHHDGDTYWYLNWKELFGCLLLQDDTKKILK
jgi:hypothetical protein